MWQQLFMGSRRLPTAGQAALTAGQQAQIGGEAGSSIGGESNSRRSSNTTAPSEAEHAALVAVRRVLRTWKARHHGRQQQQKQQLEDTLCASAAGEYTAALANSSSSMLFCGAPSVATTTSGGGKGGEVARGATTMEATCAYAEDKSFSASALRQQPAQQQQQQHQEDFLASLQQLLHLLQEQRIYQVKRQQQSPRRDDASVGTDDHQQLRASGETPSPPPPAAAAVSRAEASRCGESIKLQPAASASPKNNAAVDGTELTTNSLRGSFFSSAGAGPKVLQKLLSTSTPLSYPEIQAYIHAVVRQQQQRQQQHSLEQRGFGGGEGQQGQLFCLPWHSSSSRIPRWYAAEAAAAAEEPQRQPQKEDIRKSYNDIHPALLLLGSPSPRYLPKRPRGARVSSRQRCSSSSGQSSMENNVYGICYKSSAQEEEEKDELYQEWLQHVHGVYLHQFDDADEYRDEFDPGYRILDISEVEYIRDYNTFKHNPIELVGGLAAGSKRPQPPPAPLFTRSRTQVLSSSSSNANSPAAGADYLPAAGVPSDASSIAYSIAQLTSAGMSAHAGSHCGMRFHLGRSVAAPTAAPHTPLVAATSAAASAANSAAATTGAAATFSPAAAPSAATAPAVGGAERGCLFSSASRGSSPCFGQWEESAPLFPLPLAGGAAVAATQGTAAGSGTGAVQADEATHSVLFCKEKQAGCGPPAWGGGNGEGEHGAPAAAETDCGWLSECPVAWSSCSGTSLQTSKSSSNLQSGSTEQSSSSTVHSSSNAMHSSSSAVQRRSSSSSSYRLRLACSIKGAANGKESGFRGDSSLASSSNSNSENSGTETGDTAEQSEHSLKGSVALEDELADCGVQLASSSIMNVYAPDAACPPAAAAAGEGVGEGGGAKVSAVPSSSKSVVTPLLLGPQQQYQFTQPLQQQEQQQDQGGKRSRAEERQGSGVLLSAAKDVAVQTYRREMRRATVWRARYCNGDVALFRKKQEERKYAGESCYCSCRCCGRARRSDATGDSPTAAESAVPLHELALACTATAAAPAAASEYRGTAALSVRQPGKSLHAAAAAPLYPSSGDVFYPVRVAGRHVLAFPRQQQQQRDEEEKLWKEERFLLQGAGNATEDAGLLPVTPECVAAALLPAQQLPQQSCVPPSQPWPAAAAVDDRRGFNHGSSSSNRTSAPQQPQEEAVHSPAAISVQQPPPAITATADARFSSNCRTYNTTRSSSDISVATARQVKQQQPRGKADAVAATSNSSPRFLAQMRGCSANECSSSCCCSCGCSVCCGSVSRDVGTASPPAARMLSTPIVFDCFYLKVVYERGRTGFEDHRELVLPAGSLFAGRYLVQQEVIKNEKEYMDQSLDEVRTLRYLHANGDPDLFHYVQLRDYFYHREHLVLVTELLSHNLYDFSSSLRKLKLPPFWTLGRVQRVARELLLALHFVHRLNVIHCDLKPENVLLQPSFFSDLTSYKEWWGRHPQTVMHQAAAAAAAASAGVAAAGGARQPPCGGEGGAMAGKRKPAGVGEGREGEVPAKREAAESAIAEETQHGITGRTAAKGGGKQLVGEEGAGGAAVRQEGGGRGLRENVEEIESQLCSMQASSSSSSDDRWRRMTGIANRELTAAPAGREAADLKESLRARSSNRSGAFLIQREEAGWQLFSPEGEVQQQQDCERPPKQQYIRQQQQATAPEQETFNAGRPCVPQQPQQSQALMRQQHSVEDHLCEQQVCVTPSLSKINYDCLSHSSSAVYGSSSTIPEDGGTKRGEAASTAAPLSVVTPSYPSPQLRLSPPLPALPCSTQLPAPSSSLQLPPRSASRCDGKTRASLCSSAAAAVAAGLRGGGRGAQELFEQGMMPAAAAATKLEKERRGRSRGQLRDFAATAAAAAAAELSVKLIDFGNSCRTSDALLAYVQSRSYRAPEVLLELPYETKIDIWSLGCVLFELFTGVVLFMNEGIHSLLARIVGIIGQLPWYMVDSSPKRHALFDADGYLWTIIHTDSPVPPSVTLPVRGAGELTLAGVDAAAGSAAAGAAGAAAAGAWGGSASVAEFEEGAAAASAAEEDAGTRRERSEQWRRHGLGDKVGASGGGDRLDSNNSSTCHSTGSCEDRRSCSGLQQQEQEARARGISRDSRQQRVAQTVKRGKVPADEDRGREKGSYEKASQALNTSRDELLNSFTAATDREGTQTAAAVGTERGGVQTGAAAAAERGGAQTGAATEAGKTAVPCFGSADAAQRACSGAAGVAGAATVRGVVAAPAASGLNASTRAEARTAAEGGGGRILRFLLPKRSSLKQRLRVDDHLFIHFLECMLMIDPTERWSAEQLLQHPFLQRGLYQDGL